MSLGVEKTTNAQNAFFWVRRFSEAQKNRQDAQTRAEATGRPGVSEDSDAQNHGEKPSWLDHLVGVLFCGFANDLSRVVDQGERDFTGAHLENCLRENRGQHDSFGVLG